MNKGLVFILSTSMVENKIIAFFWGLDAQQSRSEIDTIKSFNAQTDSTADINRKKTAQTWETMSNSFNKDTQFSGKFVCVVSHNWHKWYSKNIFDVVDDVAKKIENLIWTTQRSNISQITIPRLPSFQNYFWQKTIIISDFFWSPKQINECIQACKDNKLRCVVIPLLSDKWMIKHPLQEQYPQYFWSLE